MGLLNMGGKGIPPTGMKIEKEVELNRMNNAEKRSAYNKILTDVWGFSPEDVDENIKLNVPPDIIDKDLRIYRDIHDVDRKRYLKSNKSMDDYKTISDDGVRKEWVKRITKKGVI